MIIDHEILANKNTIKARFEMILKIHKFKLYKLTYKFWNYLQFD